MKHSRVVFIFLLTISWISIHTYAYESSNVIGSRFLRDKKDTLMLKSQAKITRENIFPMSQQLENSGQLANRVSITTENESHQTNKAEIHHEEKATHTTQLENARDKDLHIRPNNEHQEKKEQLPILKDSFTANAPPSPQAQVQTQTPVPTQFATPNTTLRTKVAYGGFFDSLKKNSKDNENLAWKALGMFVAGVACFFLSIHLTCWNERRAVKEAEFTDWISRQDRCISVANGVALTSIDSTKSYIVSGNLELKEAAKLPDLPIEFSHGAGRTLLIKYEVEHFAKFEVSQSKTDEEGETTYTSKDEFRWVKFFGDSGSNGQYAGKVVAGVGLINGVYGVNLEKLAYLVDSHQTASLADNNYVHVFKESEEAALLEFFKKGANSDVEIKVFVKDDFVYIIRGNAGAVNKGSFSHTGHNFQPEDRRVRIKYFHIPPTYTVTAVGQVIAGKEEKTFEFKPFETNLKKAGCHYFCCCCADSDETYKVDLLYEGTKDRDQIVDQLKAENDACTCGMRILAFLTHFFAYYGMLYPLIMLVGMIPFIGAIGATFLIFVAFFLACISFLFLIACAWICARPFFAVFVFAIIFILMFTGDKVREKLKENGTIKDEPESNGSGVSVSVRATENPKFLGF